MKDDFIRLVKTQWIEVENNELKNYALVQAIMKPAVADLSLAVQHVFSS